MTREALKGAKRPKPLCGHATIAALRPAAPFKPLAGSLGAPTASPINPVLVGWPGSVKKPGPCRSCKERFAAYGTPYAYASGAIEYVSRNTAWTQ